MRVLLAEDDEQLRLTLARGLRQRSFAVDDVGDGAQALALATVTPYAALIVDVMMPGYDGIALCQELRRRGIHTPILILTAKDAVEDRVNGLDAGADDYLVKPFVFEELLARVRALLRRNAAMVPNTLAVADLEVDTRRQEVRRHGKVIPLAAREYAFLEYLVRHAGEVVSRGALATHVWDDNHDPGANLIDVYVSRLRRKIDGAGGPRLIHTRRGAGVLLGLDTSRP
jgi:two-component system copper resistance phosphate regulon response regulator CusR